MNNNYDSLTVNSDSGNYEVVFYKSLHDLDRFSQLPENYLVICDKNVFIKYKSIFVSVFNGPFYIVDSIESAKTLDGVQLFSKWLIENNAHKKTTIVAIGGGVIQDIATFTSHIFYRGIDLLFIPTTLLSQADSCIGAKCGINILPYKNQLGVFHSPKLVIIIEEFLLTLTELDIISGFGEILKLSVTGPNHFFLALLEYLEVHKFSCKEILPIIRSSLLAKLAIIEEDEFELDLRRILNYGHSFGHSLESLTKNQIPHGHAVLFGMDIINYLGFKWGITSKSYYENFTSSLSKYFGGFRLPKNINSEILVSGLRNDKKAEKTFINFAIPVKVGEIVIHRAPLNSDLIKLVDEYLNEKSVFRAS
jgi:3-dehydroquinate synthase